MNASAKNDGIGLVSDACHWVAESLAAAPRGGEEEWGVIHAKMVDFGREFIKMLPLATSEEEKIALLQAGHDALYLLSGNVTRETERRYLEVALPIVEKLLDKAMKENPAWELPLLNLLLNILYSTVFLDGYDPVFTDRLVNYTACRLDALRRTETQPSPQLQKLFDLEEELYAEA